MVLAFNFVTHNVKGLGDKKKRLKQFKRLQDEIRHRGIIFMQETHSCGATSKKWIGEFGKNNKLLYSHGKSNARGVATRFCGNFDYDLKQSEIDPDGRFLIVEALINGQMYLLVNFYNENDEKSQLKLLEKLELALKKFKDIESREIIWSGDFNLIFDDKLDAEGGSPKLKKDSIVKVVKNKETYDLVDIWRVRNDNLRRFTFTQRHATGFLQRRLDYIFVSNSLQYAIQDVEIGTAFGSDHAPVKMSVQDLSRSKRGPGFWKFNKSLTTDPATAEEAKALLREIRNDQALSLQKQANFEFMKYKIRKFFFHTARTKARERRRVQSEIETRLKPLEGTPNFNQNLEYVEKKSELEDLYEQQVEGARIRSKVKDYEHGEKSNKYFLNLEKYHGKIKIGLRRG